MRTQDLMPALAALAALGCAELAAIAPSVTIDVAATHRDDSRSTEGEGAAWSWGVGCRLGARLGAVPPGELGGVSDHPAGELEPLPSSRCRIAPICAWEARARARAIARARAVSIEEEP